MTRQERCIVKNGLLRQREEEILLRMVYYDKTRKIYCYKWSVTRRGRGIVKNGLL